MTRFRIANALLALALIAPLNGAGSEKGGYNKGAFEKTMEDANKHSRRLLGALVAEDWRMTNSSADE